MDRRTFLKGTAANLVAGSLLGRQALARGGSVVAVAEGSDYIQPLHVGQLQPWAGWGPLSSLVIWWC